MKDCLPCSVHPLNNKVVQHHLLFGSLNDVFFHRTLSHQTINIYLKKIKDYIKIVLITLQNITADILVNHYKEIFVLINKVL